MNLPRIYCKLSEHWITDVIVTWRTLLWCCESIWWKLLNLECPSQPGKTYYATEEFIKYLLKIISNIKCLITTLRPLLCHWRICQAFDKKLGTMRKKRASEFIRIYFWDFLSYWVIIACLWGKSEAHFEIMIILRTETSEDPN